jgi:anti-sigma factor RsiW
MKTETLETLLIDRALGALSPEVAELLESHLIQNPDAVRHAESVESTVRLARTAVAGAPVSTGHAPPLDRVRKTLRVRRRQAFATELSKLAACLLLGLTIGLIGRSGGSPAGAPEVSAAVVGPLIASDAANAAGGRNGFWSLANFAPGKPEQSAAGVRQDSRYRLHWDSPVKMPHLEENL